MTEPEQNEPAPEPPMAESEPVAREDRNTFLPELPARPTKDQPSYNPFYQ